MSAESELFPNASAGDEAVSAELPESGSSPQPEISAKAKSRTRVERKFPAMPFSEAIELAEAIQAHPAGQKVRRLTLFENWISRLIVQQLVN